MLEKDLNRIIVSSFKAEGFFAHKISDDASQFSGTSKKPFDWLAVTNDTAYYGESKLLKPLKAFNFNIVEDHQYSSLCKISDNPVSVPLLSIGAWKSREYFYVFFFHIKLIRLLKSLGINSILKKHLDILIANGKYLKVEKSILNVKNIPNAIVKDVWF